MPETRQSPGSVQMCLLSRRPKQCGVDVVVVRVVVAVVVVVVVPVVDVHVPHSTGHAAAKSASGQPASEPMPLQYVGSMTPLHLCMVAVEVLVVVVAVVVELHESHCTGHLPL